MTGGELIGVFLVSVLILMILFVSLLLAPGVIDLIAEAIKELKISISYFKSVWRDE